MRRGGPCRNGLRPLPHREKGAEPTRVEGTKMAADHGNDTRTGRMPALNTERVYTTTIPAEELARAGGPLPRAGVRGTGLSHQRGPHGDAGAR
jgi:hypothetical protein